MWCYLDVGAENKLQTQSEQENIGPGTTANLTTALEQGPYHTACKPNMMGDFVGLADFTVMKGREATQTDDEKEEKIGRSRTTPRMWRIKSDGCSPGRKLLPLSLIHI